MAETVKFKLNVLATNEEMKASFADTVVFEGSNGYVLMNFLQTKETDDKTDGVHVKQGFLASRVALSWDHFVQLLPQIAAYAERMKPSVEEEREDSLNILQGLGKRDA